MWPTEVCYASEAFSIPAPSRFPSIHRDNRRRRANRSSSDEQPLPAWDGFVEEDFRAGGPVLSDTPVVNVQIPGSHPHYQRLVIQGQLLTEICRIARNGGLNLQRAIFVGRRPRFEEQAIPILTALLIAHRNHPEDRGWVKVARDIRGYLHQKGVNGINVEITDPRFDQSPHIFPCGYTDAIFPIWEEVGLAILKSINLSGVLSLGRHRIGNSTVVDECPPTILVSVSKDSKRDWKPIREKIIDILNHFRLRMVAVIIRKDIGILNFDPPPERELLAEDCTTHVKVGYSLSVHNSTLGHGTFGGWLELQNPQSQQWVAFGITCTHCVLPDNKEIPEKRIPIVEKWKESGVAVGDATATEMLVVDCPSALDVNKAIERMQGHIRVIEKNETFRSGEKVKEQDNFVIPPEERNHAFGTVFAASGLRECFVRTTQNAETLPSIMDWALIKPHLNRGVGSNDLQTHGPVLGPPAAPEANAQPIKLLSILPEGYSLVDSTLYKVGRKTGLTRGPYNGLRTALVATRQVEGKTIEKPTWEHCVLGNFNAPFEEPGDAGSLVFSLWKERLLGCALAEMVLVMLLTLLIFMIC